MRTGWLTGRDQQIFDLLFDNLVGGWNMLAVPCFSLYYSWVDSWPGWSENPKTDLTPFTVVLAGLPEPRQQPRPPATPRPGDFSYLRGGQQLHLPGCRVEMDASTEEKHLDTSVRERSKIIFVKQ